MKSKNSPDQPPPNFSQIYLFFAMSSLSTTKKYNEFQAPQKQKLLEFGQLVEIYCACNIQTVLVLPSNTAMAARQTGDWNCCSRLTIWKKSSIILGRLCSYKRGMGISPYTFFLSLHFFFTFLIKEQRNIFFFF